MKTCFSTLGCPDWTFSKIISFASDLGFNGVEIRGILGELFAPAINEFTPPRVEATKKSLKSLSLSIPCLSSSCNLNDENVLEAAYAYVDTASALETPFIQLLGDTSPSPMGDISMKMIVTNLSEIALYAKGKGVMPLIETNGFFAKTRTLAVLLKEIEVDNIGVLYDVHHPYRFFDDGPAYVLKNIGPYIKHVHIKDSVMVGKQVSYKMPGEGNIPIAPSIRALNDLGYEGFYSFEWDQNWGPSLKNSEAAFVQFKLFMDTVSV